MLRRVPPLLFHAASSSELRSFSRSVPRTIGCCIVLCELRVPSTVTRIQSQTRTLSKDLRRARWLGWINNKQAAPGGYLSMFDFASYKSIPYFTRRSLKPCNLHSRTSRSLTCSRAFFFSALRTRSSARETWNMSPSNH